MVRPTLPWVLMHSPEPTGAHPVKPLLAPRVLVLSHRHCPLPVGGAVNWYERVPEGLAYLQRQQAQGRKGADLVILDASLPRAQALALLHPLRRDFGLCVMLRRGAQ